VANKANWQIRWTEMYTNDRDSAGRDQQRSDKSSELTN